MADVLALWGVIGVLIAVNGLFVAAEFAMIGVRPTRVAQLVEEGRPMARWVRRILRQARAQDRYFATAQLGITVASLVLGMYGEEGLVEHIVPVLAPVGGFTEAVGHGVAVVVAVGMLTFLHVVVGEMVPKTLALRYPEQTVLGVARSMRLADALLGPAVTVLNRAGDLVLGLLRIPTPTGEERILSAEELAMVIGESAEGGLIEPREGQILLGIFDFGEREVHQVMTPRTRVEAYPVDIAEEALAARLGASRHTRFPIYEGDIDHVVGVLHLKDFIRDRLRVGAPYDLAGILRPARMVPEHLPVERLLETFRAERAHLAIVIDEYGGTAGLVTLEDLVEQLVGEVRDEFDLEATPILVVAPGVLDVAGEVQLVDLDDYVPLPAARPNVDTVGGLVVTLLGRPAVPGDRVTLGEVALTVTRVAGLAIERVRVERAAGQGAGEPAA